jgi:hypothetical protein
MVKLLQYRGRIGHAVHGFGYKPDPVGHMYNLFFRHPASAIDPSTLPKRTRNVLSAPSPWDQGQTGSCFGHGMGGQITTTFAAHGKPLATPVSPSFIYKITRAVDRPSPAVPLQDEGSQPNSGVRALALWGAALEGEVDGGRTAASPDYASFLEQHVNTEPKLGDLEKAGKRLITNFNAISDNDAQKLVSCMQALAGGHTVGIAVDAGNDKFQGADGKLPLGFCGSVPDHWIFLLDYAYVGALRADGDLPASMAGLSDSQRLWLLQNSWGRFWPSATCSGRIWVDDDFIARGTFNLLVTNLGL